MSRNDVSADDYEERNSPVERKSYKKSRTDISRESGRRDRSGESGRRRESNNRETRRRDSSDTRKSRKYRRSRERDDKKRRREGSDEGRRDKRSRDSYKDDEKSRGRKKESSHRKDESKSQGGKKKRVSRFSAESEKVTIPGMPLNVNANMTEPQRKCYLLQLRIEEITMKLRTGNIGLTESLNRSPSPEPIYDTMGVRINTREMRLRTRLEEERDNLISEVLLINPEYIPPLDIKANTSKITDRVFIPQDAYPSVNFIGLLIGPRGNTLKKLEQESGCKIIIRGKGSLKEGKMRTMPLPGEDEPLHALLTANCEEDIRRGRQIIQKIINDCISNPSGENELRKMQLRELAVLNGTLVASEIKRCKNCGADDHRHWECTQAQNFTNMIICEKCGGGGHLSSDCIYDGETAQTAEAKSKLDTAYKELMTELGVKDEPMGGLMGNILGTRNVPSILALPKVMVAQLPWASAGAGLISGGLNSAPLALPAADPSYMAAMNYAPAGIGESLGVNSSVPVMPPPGFGWTVPPPPTVFKTNEENSKNN